jgi:hypothetical protein
MTSPTPNEKNEKAPPKSSWFGSWFDNSTDMRQEIRKHLDTYEEEKKRYEDQMTRLPGLFGAAGVPFGFPPNMFGGRQRDCDATTTAPDDQPAHNPEQEFQDFFQKLGEEMMVPHPAFGSTSSSSQIFSSGLSVMMRDSSVDGAQIDVQVPPKTLGSDVTVDVVQELPCVVRYRVPSGNKSKASVQNQVKLQDYNDCSKVSAVLRQNMLTIKAPVQEKKESMEQRKSRVIPVTEHD